LKAHKIVDPEPVEPELIEPEILENFPLSLSLVSTPSLSSPQHDFPSPSSISIPSPVTPQNSIISNRLELTPIQVSSHEFVSS
jgi:hypothetical protein